MPYTLHCNFFFIRVGVGDIKNSGVEVEASVYRLRSPGVYWELYEGSSFLLFSLK